ncbi:MAG: S-layer homology domain-containing protein [Oscillospiraceae bacterium]|nr:S-layer homology domain-containing protein [Oscillospiraceae bacterium]
MMKKTIGAALAALLLLGCLSGVTLAAGQVPTIADASAATAEAAVILSPSAQPYTLPTSYTREQKQQILQETAKQYYYHNPYVQYDGREVWEGGPNRQYDTGFPEDAAFDSTVYSVCSDYCYKVYYNAFEHRILGRDYARTRSWAVEPTGSTNIIAYQYIGPSAPKEVTEGEKDLQKALRESRKVLQPGDIIVAANSDAGHAMLFVGDILGDGKEYVLHCWGSSYTIDSGSDPRETDGSIKLQTVDQLCYGPDGSPNYYLGRESLVRLGFAILRPLDDPTFPSVPTAWGASRLLFPGLTITRELDRTKYDGALPGEEVPVTVTVTNNGKQEYKELPVEEYVPENATLVEGSATVGAKVEGKTLRWSVKVPAGKSISLSYKVRMPDTVGTLVTFPHGKVAEIPSRETQLIVGGKKLTDAQKTALAEYAKNKVKKGDFKDLDFFNEVYGKALGVDIGLPATTAELLKKLTTAKPVNGIKFCFRRDDVAAENQALDHMIVLLNFAGRRVMNDGSMWSRVREYQEAYYQPGDIFVCLKNNSVSNPAAKDIELMLYLGDGAVLYYDGEGVPKTTTFAATISRSLRYSVAMTLRPTQAYADLNARVYAGANAALPFTDVTEADWFYSYVRDLYNDGTVSGMTPTTFVPKGNLTYGQALKLIVCAIDGKEQDPLAGGHWASGYMRYAARQGWIGGTVELDAKITRLEFCQIAAKAKKLTEQPASNPFTDTGDASVLALVSAGVINGMTPTSFAPDEPLTRAQISKIICALRSV